MPGLVHYTVDGALARLTLDSPANRNALSTALLHEVREGLTAAAGNPAVRAVVIGHTGGTFCAGVDLAEVTSDRAAEAGVEHMYDFVNLLRQIVELPVPVIAAVNGHVRAGGLGLTAACDIGVAGPESTFALTEVRIGVGPAIISLTLLPKLDPRAAGRYYVTGERFGAQEAAHIGLVTVAADDVEAAVTQFAGELAKGSPQGLRASKALVTAPVLEGFDRRADELVKRAAQLFLSEEAREGIAAFREKRPPNWL